MKLIIAKQFFNILTFIKEEKGWAGLNLSALNFLRSNSHFAFDSSVLNRT